MEKTFICDFLLALCCKRLRLIIVTPNNVNLRGMMLIKQRGKDGLNRSSLGEMTFNMEPIVPIKY